MKERTMTCGALALLTALLASAPLVIAQTTPAEKAHRANELVQSGKPAEAIPLFKELAAAFPSELGLRVNLVIAEYKAGRYQETIAECQSLVKQKPDLFPAWLFLGASYLEMGEGRHAVEALEKSLTLQPADRNARVMLADALLEENRPQDAAANFEKASESMPDSPRVLFGLARSYEGLGGEVFLRLEKAAPGSPEWLALGADFERDRSQFARAFERYRQALSLRPSFPGRHTAIAEIYEKTGHPDWAAIERAKEPHPVECPDREPACQFAAGRLKEILSVRAGTPDAMYWQSKAWHALSQQAYAKLNGLPASSEKFQAAALAAEQNGRYAEAAVAWKEALRMAPDSPRIKRHLALALCNANDCVSALPIIEDLLAREPSAAMLNLLCGTALNAARKPGEALSYLEKAVKLDGGLLAARAALGEAFLEAGKPEKAVPELEAASKEDPDGSRHYQLARALRETGKPELAAAVLREYKEILKKKESAEAEEPHITAP
ncbi:MAG: tetratricopeptide repeat protein [Bryobacteraceae bacterium]